MLFATKLKNSLTTLAEQHGMEIKVELKNIAVNGQRRGCSGFVTCGDSCVYVNTEHSIYGPISSQSMCRYAKDTKDFSSVSLSRSQRAECVKSITRRSIAGERRSFRL